MNRNVVLVTIDSLRADHCGYMGYERNTTPTLDEMSKNGVTFENAIAPGPSTYESMPAIFTGQFLTLQEQASQERNGSDFLDERMQQIELNMRCETIPEWFARQGYTTGAFTSNPYTGRHTSFARGFDFYEDFIDRANSSGRARKMFKRLPVLSELENGIAMLEGDRASRPWQSYYHQLSDWIETVDEPYFLWIFLLDPHTPYLVHGHELSRGDRAAMYYHNWKLWTTKKWGVPARLANLNREALVSLYDRTIRSADRFLARLLADLDSTEPIVAVHADHGEAFDEHGIYGHREYLYEEHVHVPFVIYDPRSTQSTRITRPVSLIALPELLRRTATGVTIDPSCEYVHSQALFSRRLAVRGETWKYLGPIHQPSNGVVDEALYDLEADPDERVNLIDTREELATLGRRLAHGRVQHERELRSIRESLATL